MIYLKIFNTTDQLQFSTPEEAKAFLRDNGYTCFMQGNNWVAFHTYFESEEYLYQRKCISRFVYKGLVNPILQAVPHYPQEYVMKWKSVLTSCFSEFVTSEPSNFIDNQSYYNFFCNINEALRRQIFRCTLNALYKMMDREFEPALFIQVSRILLSDRIAHGLEYMLLQLIYNLQNIFDKNLKCLEGICDRNTYKMDLRYGLPLFNVFGEVEDGSISFYTSTINEQDHITLLIDEILLKQVMYYSFNPSGSDVHSFITNLREKFMNLFMPLMQCDYTIHNIAYDRTESWSGITIEINIDSFYCPY